MYLDQLYKRCMSLMEKHNVKTDKAMLVGVAETTAAESPSVHPMQDWELCEEEWNEAERGNRN